MRKAVTGLTAMATCAALLSGFTAFAFATIMYQRIAGGDVATIFLIGGLPVFALYFVGGTYVTFLTSLFECLAVPWSRGSIPASMACLAGSVGFLVVGAIEFMNTGAGVGRAFFVFAGLLALSALGAFTQYLRDTAWQLDRPKLARCCLWLFALEIACPAPVVVGALRWQENHDLALWHIPMIAWFGLLTLAIYFLCLAIVVRKVRNRLRDSLQ